MAAISASSAALNATERLDFGGAPALPCFFETLSGCAAWVTFATAWAALEAVLATRAAAVASRLLSNFALFLASFLAGLAFFAATLAMTNSAPGRPCF